MAGSRNLEVERLSQQEDVKRALEQATGTTKPETPTAPPKERLWLGTYALFLTLFAVLHYLLRWKLIPAPVRFSDFLVKVIKTRLIQKMLAELNKALERVRFPKGDLR